MAQRLFLYNSPMKSILRLIGVLFYCLVSCQVFGQQPYINGEIFIPLNNRSEIWIKPKLDTLENGKSYEFKIRVNPEFLISQFLFEKGLAVQDDSLLTITPNSKNYGDIDTATLRVIVTSIKGSRIMLFQKAFIIKVPPKMYPVITNPKINLVVVNDKTTIERNQTYPRELLTTPHTFLAMYDSERTMRKIDVQAVTIALFEKEGKQYKALGDTLSTEAVHELRKIKKPTPVYIRVDGQLGKIKKTVWNRIIVDKE